jgi:Fic family protein
MMTFRRFSNGVRDIPAATGWSLADLGEAIGKQELFTRQSPQRLRALREHALIESAVSSNRIEGVEVERKRINTLMFGQPLLKDRQEEEVRGYRDALNMIHSQGRKLPISETTIRRIHRLCRGKIWDAGRYKEKTQPIIEKYANGHTRVRFMPVEAGKATQKAMREVTESWRTCLSERWVHPLVAVGALALDFLCIHPFRDGNGRVARLLTLLACYHSGADVGRYISLERLIEHNKDRYYQTLEQSSKDWHKGKHNPWPFISYFLWILNTAYGELERRVGQVKVKRGEKSELVATAIARRSGEFDIGGLERECPGVSVDLIRRVLKQLREEGQLVCLGRGRNAKWRKTMK